jgi:hypothetical protein
MREAHGRIDLARGCGNVPGEHPPTTPRIAACRQREMHAEGHPLRFAHENPRRRHGARTSAAYPRASRRAHHNQRIPTGAWAPSRKAARLNPSTSTRWTFCPTTGPHSCRPRPRGSISSRALRVVGCAPACPSTTVTRRALDPNAEIERNAALDVPSASACTPPHSARSAFPGLLTWRCNGAVARSEDCRGESAGFSHDRTVSKTTGSHMRDSHGSCGSSAGLTSKGKHWSSKVIGRSRTRAYVQNANNS